MPLGSALLAVAHSKAELAMSALAAITANEIAASTTTHRGSVPAGFCSGPRGSACILPPLLTLRSDEQN